MDVNKKFDAFFDKIECPVCKSRISTYFNTLEIPYFGEVIVFTLNCQSCGYRKNDLFNIYEKEPKRYIFKFDNEMDLKIRVIRSGSCKIEIPEFGTVIEPGGDSEGYITNIEGILYRIQDILIMLEKNSQKKRTLDRIQNLKIDLENALEGNLNFTLILEDPCGNSAIISEDNSKLIIEDL